MTPEISTVADRASAIRDALPPGGPFAGQTWRTATVPFPLEARLSKELDSLGRVLLQFYRATNLLYRHSVEGKQPPWIAQWLDQGKPADLVELQREIEAECPDTQVILADDGLVVDLDR